MKDFELPSFALNTFLRLIFTSSYQNCNDIPMIQDLTPTNTLSLNCKLFVYCRVYTIRCLKGILYFKIRFKDVYKFWSYELEGWIESLFYEDRQAWTYLTDYEISPIECNPHKRCSDSGMKVPVIPGSHILTILLNTLCYMEFNTCTQSWTKQCSKLLFKEIIITEKLKTVTSLRYTNKIVHAM